MTTFNRKATPRVKRARVQKKNNWVETPDYYNTPQALPIVDRRRPGASYRHFLKQRDIYAFIDLLPDWPELSRGLNTIVLAPGQWDADGYHLPGVVHLCAWESELWRETDVPWYEQHRDILERLEVPCERRKQWVLCKWTESTARAHQLLHVLLHELGHHHDRMTTQSKRASRGKPYAEAYARLYGAQIWDRYFTVFGFR